MAELVCVYLIRFFVPLLQGPVVADSGQAQLARLVSESAVVLTYIYMLFRSSAHVL